MRLQILFPLSCLLLAACSLTDPPPEREDMIAALEKSRQQEVQAFYPQRCRRAGREQYLCDYEVTYQGAYPQTDTSCFYRTENGWGQSSKLFCDLR